MKKIITIFTTAILFTMSTQAVFAEEPVFAADEHCLAYYTTKTMFFFADVEVIGKSCEVTAEMHWNASGQQAQVEVSVPASSLKSGIDLRDEDMPEILKADLTPNIRFVSEWLGKSVLLKMLDNQQSEVSGDLEVAGGKFPVKFALIFTKQPGYVLIEGRYKTIFSALKIVVPAVVGGLIADPHDDLELLVHLRSDKISGVEKETIKNE